MIILVLKNAISNNKRIRDMHLGQEGIVFKLYVTPSETQPIIRTDKGNEAKKIQNVYDILPTDF